MPKHYSETAKTNLNATSAPAPFLTLIELNHPSFDAPARLVADVVDLVHQGHRYTAIPVEVTLPDDAQGKLPQAQLRLDNVGRVLTDEIEAARGLEGGTCTLLQVLRTHPDHVEWGMDMDILSVSLDAQRVTARLGFEDLLNLPAVTIAFTPEYAPGLF
ncbi:DUF1833 family protein [Vibrio coralliilyticus]|uniref:DUF1833 family protein n=1 Tax=Vibrio coralliilyticus TaxID=190893 RepID=UPI001850BE73|nr:DUF1833 family protein [Vibrio coralliilyticus]NUW66963.1 DUF1833 family protein [Vibrio coralliilyticus]NUW69157.1 DUF1833 family protein [Vibrio coralliilyticus]